MNISLNCRKACMLNDLNRLFKRIEDNKETLRMDLVEEDLKKLQMEIGRTIQRMGQ